jgi:hypothetical protein
LAIAEGQFPIWTEGASVIWMLTSGRETRLFGRPSVLPRRLARTLAPPNPVRRSEKSPVCSLSN